MLKPTRLTQTPTKNRQLNKSTSKPSSTSSQRLISTTPATCRSLKPPHVFRQRRLKLSTITAKPIPNPNPNDLVILGIETSCDDTAIAIVNSQKQVVSNETLTQLGLHQLHGGVVPTVAMRSHAITINYLLSKSLLAAGVVSINANSPPLHATPTHPTPQLPDFLPTPPPAARRLNHKYLANTPHNHIWLEQELHKMDQFRPHTFLRGRTDSPTPSTAPDPSLHLDIDAVAFTLGPGLSGSLAVGVDTAKALGKRFSLPIVPVNHIIAHTTVAQLQDDGPNYPYLGLVISGGHTQLNYVRDETCVTIISSTADDAVGEAFDKIYRTMNMDGFDFRKVQEALKNERTVVKNVLQYMKLKSLWPEHMGELIDKSGNELLSDAYTQILKESGSAIDISALQQQLISECRHFYQRSPHPSQPFNFNSDFIEQISLSFVNKIQTIPDRPTHKTALEYVGCVNDLFNYTTTPAALFQTFSEVQKRLSNNNQHRGEGPQTNPSTDTTTTPPPGHPLNPTITPQTEREILETLSQSKTPPHGAQIELAASLYIELATALHAYDFLITKVLQQTTNLLIEEAVNNVYFAQQSNRCFGLHRKASQFTILHRFLPIVPLPLPWYDPSPAQSYSGFSLAGLKTKIRQHCVTESGLMQSVITLRGKSVGADEEDEFQDSEGNQSSSCGNSRHRRKSSPHSDKNSNPFNRTKVNNIHEVPPYLSHLLSPDCPVPYASSISNIYRLTAASQFQTTTTQHFVHSLSRSLQYLNHSIPGQDGVYLSTQPQSLHMLSILANDPSLHIGHPSNTPTSLPPNSIWKKFNQSILPLDKPVDIVIGGGVACNKVITRNLQHHFNSFSFTKTVRPTHSDPNPPAPPPSPTFKVHTVVPKNCGDNGVMIAWSGLKKFQTLLLSKNTAFDAQNFGSDNYFSDDPITSHIIDATMLDQQQKIMDQEFMKLVNQTTNEKDRQQLSTPTGAASFSVLYQLPKWPLPEVFVNKPIKSK